MRRRGGGDRPLRIVGRDLDIIGFGHGRDLLHLADSPGVAEIRLDHIDIAPLQQPPIVPFGVEPFARRQIHLWVGQAQAL